MHLLERRRRVAFAPKDRRGLKDWSRGIKLPAAYSLAGSFDPDISPWLDRPFGAMDDPIVRELTCISAVRTGKTMVGDIYLAKRIATDAVPMMFNVGNDKDAEEHAELRFIPLLRSIPECSARFTGRPHDVTKSLVKFIDGTYCIVQGLVNPNNFDSKGICVLVNDEGHKAPAGNIAKAKSRTDDFRHKCKVLNISQGGVPGDDMDVAYQRGTMERFGFKCPSCGIVQPFEWKDAKGEYRLKWDSNETTRPEGRWDFDKMAETIRYECANPECTHSFRDVPEQRRQMTYQCGCWLPPENKLAPRDTVSCSWNQLCVPWIPWREMARDWVEAIAAYELGDFSKLKNFFQRRLALPFEEQNIWFKDDGGAPPSDYAMGDEWPEEAHRYLVGDVQAKGGRHFVCVIFAASLDGKSRRLWGGKLDTYEQIKEKQEEFAIQGMRVGLDSAHETAEVQAACAKYGWVSLKGEDSEGWPCIIKGEKIQLPVKLPPARISIGLGTKAQKDRRYCYHFQWSKPRLSDILHRRVSGSSLYFGVPEDIEEVATYPDPNDPEGKKKTGYWLQMRSYQKIRKRTGTGPEKSAWVRIGNRHDHYRSCELMGLAMMAIDGCLGTEKVGA